MPVTRVVPTVLEDKHIPPSISTISNATDEDIEDWIENLRPVARMKIGTMEMLDQF